MTAFAIMLFLGAAAGWIAAGDAAARPRSYLRLAAVLDAALAVSAAIPIATPAVTAIVATLVAPLLAIAAAGAFRRAPHPVLAATILAASCLAGIAAAATGAAVLSAAPQVIAVIAILTIAQPVLRRRARLYLVLGAVSLVGGAACALGEAMVARAGVLLFSAAGLLAIALASDAAVEKRQQDKAGFAIRRAR